MKITRTYKSGCRWCQATGQRLNESGFSIICPVCKGEKTVMITETEEPEVIINVKAPLTDGT